MGTELIFYSQEEDGELRRTEDINESTHVMMTTKDYLELCSVKGELMKLQTQDPVPVAQDDYNGLVNALRIVRDRALQQIDKSKADEHGYRLLRGDYRSYNKDKYKAWLITKSTPYSIKIPFKEAYSIMEQDLKNFYGYIGKIKVSYVPSYSTLGREETSVLSSADLIKICEEMADENYSGNQEGFYLDNSPKGHAVYDYFKENGIGQEITFEITKVSANYAQGVYEISYWSTTQI